MAEFSEAQGVIINGREQIGRTFQREDGTYESLDLKDVAGGEMVTVLTSEGIHELVKAGSDAEHQSALEGWQLGPTAVRLSLSEPTGNGADFIHHGIVLRERLGLRVSYPNSDRPNVVYGLGTIATIVSRKQADQVGERKTREVARVDM